MLRLVACLGVCLAVLPLPVPAGASDRSPIFGEAAVETISRSAARDITARGALADHYGSAAITHAYVAYIYAFYARNYAGSNSATEQSWYNTASLNAYYAYIYAHYAAIYSAAGM